MSKPNKIADYLKTVCEQIRWKKAHAAVSRELEDHIVDQKNAYQNSGIDEEKATDEAIRQMGDPVIVGTQLDGTYRPKPDWGIVICTMALLLLGVALRVFVNYIELGGSYYQPYPGYFSSIITPVIIGIAMFTAAYFIDFTTIGKYAKFILIQLLIISFASRFSSMSNGTLNFIMLLFPVIYAGIIYQKRNKGYLSLLLCVFYLCIPTYIICGVGLTTFAMIMLICVCILTFAVLKNWFKIRKVYGLLIIYAIPLALVAFVLFRNYSYIFSEIRDNYVLNHVQKLLSTSKFLGNGTYTPTSLDSCIKANYTMTYIIHRLGWISFIAIVALLATLIIKGLMQCRKQRSALGKLISYSVLITIIVQIIFTMLASLGILPTLASTMPLISHHSYGIVVNMVLIGIMLSVFKTGNLITDNQTQNVPLEKRKSVELLKGKLVININK